MTTRAREDKFSLNEQENKNEDDQKSTTQYVKMIAVIRKLRWNELGG